MLESILLNCTASSWVKVLRPQIPTAHNLSAPRSPVIGLAVTVSAWPWVEISQGLSHGIGGFPGVFLPRLIYGVFLESSYEQMAVSHRSLDLPTAVISVFSECREASRTAYVCVSNSLEGHPLLWDSFFFFLRLK